MNLPIPITCREDLKHLKQKLKKVDEKLEQESKKGKELERELANLQEDMPALQAQMLDLEQQLGEAQEVQNSLLRRTLRANPLQLYALFCNIVMRVHFPRLLTGAPRAGGQHSWRGGGLPC